ncbi:hypothetical protein ADEAN_001005900 [Angomonas deanei]|uniref:Uncharacterized protein n=1 Tax=Angomonas deanei TaxID=59799 RepID=A0A7G2CSI2_9TRYP|nr:hypothetical protein ADEAN_001005900 [Angomonas deanei]
MENRVKELEFNLQREKEKAEALDRKCKELSVQNVNMSQANAELRREKLALADEAKKSGKQSERVHVLLKEIEQKDAAIQAEKVRADEAAAETKEIREEAKRTIALWTQAEGQWIAEQKRLADALEEQQKTVSSLESAINSLKTDNEKTLKDLATERERREHLLKIGETSENEIKQLRKRNEALQNTVSDLEQTVFNMDLAGGNLKRELSLKEMDLQKLNDEIEKYRQNEEKLEQRITSLNDELSATKMMNMDATGEKEALHCHIADLKKELAQSKLASESAERDVLLSRQKYENAQKNVEDTVKKLKSSQDEVKDKCAEIRKHESTLNQLRVDFNKLKSEKSELEFHFNTLKNEMEAEREEAKQMEKNNEDLKISNAALTAETKALKNSLNLSEEKLVLAESAHQDAVAILKDEVKSLESEIAGHQQMILRLTEDLTAFTEKSASYYDTISKEKECLLDSKRQIRALQDEILSCNNRIFFLGVEGEKQTLFSSFCLERVHLLQQRYEEIYKCYSAERDISSSLRGKISENSEEISRLNDSLQEKTSEIESKISEISQLNAQCDGQAEDIQKYKDRLTTLSGLEEELENAKEILKQTETSRDNAESSCRHLSLHCQNIVAYEEHVRSMYTEVTKEKTEISFLFLQHLFTNSQEELNYFKAEMNSAKRKCADLDRFVKDAKIAAVRRDASVADECESLQKQLGLLKNTSSALQAENTNLKGQVKELIERFEVEKEMYQRETELKEGKENQLTKENETLRIESTKLRNALNYEVSRKCEYKKALEDSKKLREESELHRGKEKELSSEAIQKANNEALYWLQCFEKLKDMVEDSRKTGSRAPSVDQNAVSRLLEVKRKNEQQVSIRPANIGDPNDKAKKRPRISYVPEA